MAIALGDLLGRLDPDLHVDASYSFDGETRIAISLRGDRTLETDGARYTAPSTAVRELLDAVIASDLTGDPTPPPAASARLPALEIVIRMRGNELFRATVSEDHDPRFAVVADLTTAIDRVIDAARDAELATLRAASTAPPIVKLSIVRKTNAAHAVLDALERCASGVVVPELGVSTSRSWSIHATTTTLLHGDGVVARFEQDMVGSKSETLGRVPLDELARVARALVAARFHELELPPREILPTAPPVTLAVRYGEESISIEVPSPYAADVPGLRPLLDLFAEVVEGATLVLPS